MMLTLDEAITHSRTKAKELSNKAYAEVNKTMTEDEAYECNECAREHEQLAGWLEELKARREADRWIPVSEKSPDHIGVYAVTTTYGFTTASCYDGKGNWHNSNGVTFGVPFMNDWITHWQPLPQPYESEDKT